MKKVDTSNFSTDECWGIQINGLKHCENINCRWQGLTACEGKESIRTGINSKGFVVGINGIIIPETMK